MLTKIALNVKKYIKSVPYLEMYDIMSVSEKRETVL